MVAISRQYIFGADKAGLYLFFIKGPIFDTKKQIRLINQDIRSSLWVQTF